MPLATTIFSPMAIGDLWIQVATAHIRSDLADLVVWRWKRAACEAMENPWKTCGKPVENTWKTHGKHMETHGKHMEHMGKGVENSCRGIPT